MIPFNLPHNPKPPRPRQSRTPFGASWPRIIIFVMYDVLYLIRDPLIAFIIQHLPPFPSIVPSLPPPSLSLSPEETRQTESREATIIGTNCRFSTRPPPPPLPSHPSRFPDRTRNCFERSPRSFISFKRQLSPRCTIYDKPARNVTVQRSPLLEITCKRANRVSQPRSKMRGGETLSSDHPPGRVITRCQFINWFERVRIPTSSRCRCCCRCCCCCRRCWLVCQRRSFETSVQAARACAVRTINLIETRGE